MKEDYQKAFKKLTLFFLLNQKKQKRPGTSDQLIYRLPNKFRKIPLLVMYYLNKFDDVKPILSYSKNYIYKFMQANLWHQKLFHFHLFFWIWKVWKGREKITKIWISRERKELFRWNKKHFSWFLKGYRLVKK